MKVRSPKEYLLLASKGLAMGAADIVPGVSGGTIAFISGIYEELLASISSVNLNALKTLKEKGIKAFWNQINGNFLLTLVSGILISIISLSKIIQYLLEFQPILIWSFFFGLIIASTVFVSKKIKKWNFENVIGLIAGTIVAYFVTIASPTQGPEGLIFIFLAGSIAICAMILPGISGSFILLLLGYYHQILGTLSSLISNIKAGLISDVISNFTVLAAFALGCLFGLLSFSRVLNWLFKKAEMLTISILTGFMVGSLNKVWPWKKVLDYYPPNSKGVSIPSLETNVLPQTYLENTGNDPQILIALVLCVVGSLLVYFIEKIAAEK